jgi:putative ABC transport system permease protein
MRLQEEDDIPPERMAVAVVPVAILILLGLSLQLGNVNTLVMASSRCVIQLLLLGLILSPILISNRVYVVLPYVLVMIAFATREASVKPKFQYVGMWWHMLLAITVSVIFSLVFISFGVLQPDPWWDAQVIIPVGGMILGSCVSALSLGMDRFLLSLSGNGVGTIRPNRSNGNTTASSAGSPMLQTYLACGATKWEAALPSVRQAIETGLTPNLNQMSVMGLVSIPGMFTGQILAGTPPWIAAKYQIVIMFFVVSNSTWILFLCMVQAIWSCLFAKNHSFCGSLVWKRSGGRPKDIVLAFLSFMGDSFGWILHHVFCCGSTQSDSGDDAGTDVESARDQRDRSAKVLPIAPNEFVKSPTCPMEGKKCLIRLRNGRLRYGDRFLLDNVDLDVYERQIVLLSGASGTGKSSFLRALALLQPMECRELSLQGKTIGSSGGISPTEWRSQIIYVRQAGGQGMEGTPRDNLHGICQLGAQGKYKLEDRQAVERQFVVFLAHLSLSPGMMDTSWDRMSGGEAQRVYLCMLLSLDPAILLLDEPTSACDEENAKSVERMITESGVTIIWISHDPSQINRLEELEQSSSIRIAPAREDVADNNTNVTDTASVLLGSQALVAEC